MITELKVTNQRIAPPPEHCYRRWHWLRDEDGQLYLADWSNHRGWHGGWNGTFNTNDDDFDQWSYVGPVTCPERSTNV